MKGFFMLSLDCEGRWGMLDKKNNYNKKITQESLQEVYGFIFETLEKFNIRATFAFTSLFSVSPDLIDSYYRDFKEIAENGNEWYSLMVQHIEQRNYDGWIGSDFLVRARQCGHEIAWHGFSHVGLGHECHPSILSYELNNGKKISEYLNVKLKSIIFPRNKVGNLSAISKFGFEGYRVGIDGDVSVVDRIGGILKELNRNGISHDPTPITYSPMVGSPCGYFLNWPHMIRSIVPIDVTVARWNNILAHASLNRQCAHMWFHPHNLITSPAMRNSFYLILENVSKYLRGDLLNNFTLAEYSVLNKPSLNLL